MKIRSVIVGCAHMHVNEIALYISGEPHSVAWPTCLRPFPRRQINAIPVLGICKIS